MSEGVGFDVEKKRESFRQWLTGLSDEELELVHKIAQLNFTPPALISDG